MLRQIFQRLYAAFALVEGFNTRQRAISSRMARLPCLEAPNGKNSRDPEDQRSKSDSDKGGQFVR
jgi:hypothetical protein